MDDIYRVLKVISESNTKSVLATIIHVEGSAYRKEGACMLFQDDGTQIGLLSGGCLEEDLAIKAQEVLREGCAKTFVFDMKHEDDLSWGQGTGCNGIIHVLLEPINEKFREYLLTLKDRLDRRERVLLARKLTAQSDEKNLLFLTESGSTFGGWKEEIPQKLRDLLHSSIPFKAISGIQTISDMPFYIHHYWPKPRLIIFGANPDTKPLVSFAHQLGFLIIVTDWRPALCNREHFPDADQLMIGFPEEIVPKLSLTPYDFVVIMTHHFRRDQEILSLLINKKLYYLGILGPRRRTERLLGNQVIPPFLHSPIGLAISARGPEEIAISVLAEIIHTLRNGSKERTALL
ncbi:XdhC family protein [Thermaerobacillus caldiproteolyticus]|uniref:Xanthine dehydrogenase accessory factor n=1 Tax=Thermaerobacillus caldiproteolyticus TaxID=247480 RepID=A0A7V9Z9V2_9BACL|nr:XdhC family protein [Anoxybacillus caldiproteolyticus]MBA2876645.1 xanthine dehydrogenase accessory factor [Anoxybacillus caldiproteolyticus]QPA31302.1 XdhC family protein [Anoxybacillus caldiproteolyticus]